MRTFELGSRDARATPETRDACALLPTCASLAGAGTRSRCTRGTGPVCTAGSAPAPAAPASPAAPLAEAQRTQALWSPTADQRRAREGAHSPPSSADMRACWAAPRRHNARPRGLPSPRGGGVRWESENQCDGQRDEPDPRARARRGAGDGHNAEFASVRRRAVQCVLAPRGRAPDGAHRALSSPDASV